MIKIDFGPKLVPLKLANRDKSVKISDCSPSLANAPRVCRNGRGGGGDSGLLVVAVMMVVVL